MLKDQARAIPMIATLQTIPGVGIISACSLYAGGGDITSYRRCRDFAAWAGLVLKISGSGDKFKVGHISKRGDVYLRSLLVQGSNSFVARVQAIASVGHEPRPHHCLYPCPAGKRQAQAGYLLRLSQ